MFVAVSDWMKKLALGLQPWIPGRYEVLGTDGYGMSESRSVLRDHFEIDSAHIVQAALSALFRERSIDGQVLETHLSRLDIDTERPDPRLR